jgi:hypothetical protein
VVKPVQAGELQQNVEAAHKGASRGNFGVYSHIAWEKDSLSHIYIQPKYQPDWFTMVLMGVDVASLAHRRVARVTL